MQELKGTVAKVNVLVSAGIEVIFLLVAGIALSFEFRMRIILITH